MKIITLVVIICMVFITGCNSLDPTSGNSFETPQLVEEEGENSGNLNEGETKTDPKDVIDLNKKPNEAGKIMLLMYHNIGMEEKEWVRTPSNFLKDLNILYEKGYRPISLSDYVSGNITTEQGFTPVVITFDDGNLNNFEYLENGMINEESAVGLLLGFHEKQKDFPLEATFFVNGQQPFRQYDMIPKKFKFIIDNGMDIGNHTRDHNSFKTASAEEIQEQIGAQVQFVENTLSNNGYDINTLALPFGERPKDQRLTKYLASGNYQGISYENIAILNVGWNPGYSPYDKRFDHTSIPRVRASETNVDNVGMYNYIDYFDKNPQERYISDGVSDIITIPEGKKESIDSFVDKEIYTY